MSLYLLNMQSKIPNSAKCVFKGLLHEVWQWQQAMFDGSFQTFESIKRRDSVTVMAITKDKKIIVNFEEQPHRGSFISLSGGVTEEGESFLENAKRELLEETGFESAEENWLLWKKTDVLNNWKIEYWNHLFLARNCEKVSEQSLDVGEKIEVKLFEFEDFIKITQGEKFRNKEVSEMVKEILDSENVDLEKEKFKEFLFGQ